MTAPTTCDAAPAATPEIMGTYGGRLFNAAGTRLCQPRCDVCNHTIKVDDGEKWVMLAEGVLHEFSAVVCVPCNQARLAAPTAAA